MSSIRWSISSWCEILVELWLGRLDLLLFVVLVSVMMVWLVLSCICSSILVTSVWVWWVVCGLRWCLLVFSVFVIVCACVAMSMVLFLCWFLWVIVFF